MVFKTKKNIEIEDDGENENEEDSEEETIKQAVTQENSKRKEIKEEEPEESEEPKIKVSVNDILVNHEDRMRNIESLLFRLKNI